MRKLHLQIVFPLVSNAFPWPAPVSWHASYERDSNLSGALIDLFDFLALNFFQKGSQNFSELPSKSKEDES